MSRERLTLIEGRAESIKGKHDMDFPHLHASPAQGVIDAAIARGCNIPRPAIANERLKRNGAGDVVLQLKSA